VFAEECEEDREALDDEPFILFDRQPRGELDDIRQEEAAEGLRREVEEKARVASFDSMRFSKKRYSLESGYKCSRRAVASTMRKQAEIGDEDSS
jgi:hypothetical protein